jgi:hypothetical protein
MYTYNLHNRGEDLRPALKISQCRKITKMHYKHSIQTINTVSIQKEMAKK